MNKWGKFLVLLVSMFFLATFGSCDGGGSGDITFSVIYDANGADTGEVPEGLIDLKEGFTVTVVDNTGNLTKSGFTFSGWSLQIDGNGTVYSSGDNFLIVDANIILYAKWTENPTYTIIYDDNDADSGTVPENSTAYEEGQTFLVAGNDGNLEKAGYTFAGWCVDETGTGTSYSQGQSCTVAADNIVFYAKWSEIPTWNVTYDGNENTGGSVPVDTTGYEEGTGITILSNTGNLEKEDHAFAGWSEESDGTGTLHAPGSTIFMSTEDVTLYAVWKPVYTVTYNANEADSGSVPVDSAEYVENTQVTLADNTGNLEKAGYVFAGWCVNADGSGTVYAQGSSLSMGASDILLFAKWNQSYELIYNGNSNTGGDLPALNVSYEPGDMVTVAGNTGSLIKMQDGISLLFIGWNTSAEGDGTSYEVSDTFTMGSETVTLYAQWSVIRGTGPAGGLVFYDKGDYTGGWRYLEAAPVSTEWYGKEYGTNGTIVPGAGGTGIGTGQSNTTSISKWLLNNSSPSQQAAYLCFIMEYNGFSDWFLPSREELHLMYSNIKYHVYSSFSDDDYWSSTQAGGSFAYCEDFDNYADPPDKQRQVNKYYTMRVRAARAFSDGSAAKLTVAYDSNGASGGTVPVDSRNYDPGDIVSVLDNTGGLTKTSDGISYVFMGWNTALDGSGITYVSLDQIDIGRSNLTLYALWKPTYTITYDGNGSTAGTVPVDTNHYDEGDTVYLVKNPGNLIGAVIENEITQRFTGWNTKADGTGTHFDAYAPDILNRITMGSESITVYAQWTTLTGVIGGIGPGGGMVFYDTGDDLGPWRYMEVTTYNLETNAEWGAHGTLIGGTATGIGTGQANTSIIATWLNNNFETGRAAQLCDAYSKEINGTTYDDWFLPSKEEFQLIYDFLIVNDYGNFENGYQFWSSSEVNANDAWLPGTTSTGTLYYKDDYDKICQRRVRAVRMF